MGTQGIRQYFPRRIREQGQKFKSMCQALGQAIIAGLAAPNEPEISSLLSSEQNFIFRNAAAFGRDLDRPKSAVFRQYGLYGTSAAIEILSKSAQAEQLTHARSNNFTQELRAWSVAFLGLWFYLYLAVNDLSKISRSKMWVQNRTTLRNCNILRAMASSERILHEFLREDRLSSLGREPEWVQEAKRLANPETTKRVIREVFDRIRGSMVAYTAVPIDYPLRLRSSPGSAGLFKYSAEAGDLPATWNQWIFSWSNSLVSSLAAYSAGRVDDDELVQLFPHTSFVVVRSLLDGSLDTNTSSLRIDERVKLFALYALSKIDATVNAEDGIPIRLRLGPEEQRWLKRKIRSVCRRLLGNKLGLALSDAHFPYEIDLSGRGEYGDYFVVPVVPVCLYLVASYYPNWLFEPHVKDLLDDWQSAVENRDTLGSIIPFQVGEYNGTVNAVYYEEAARACGEVLINKAKFAPALGFVGWIWTRRHSLALLTGALAVLALALGLQVVGKPSTALIAAGVTLALQWFGRFIYDWAKNRLGT